MDHGFDGCPDELRRVIDDLVIDAFRHVLLQLLHCGAHIVGDLDRVRSRCLEDRNGNRLLVVEQGTQGVFGGPEFNAGDVAQTRHGAVGAGLHDDVAELFRRLQPALCIHGQLQIDADQAGGGTDNAGRGLDILLADRLGDVACGQLTLRDLLRVEPYPHGIVTGAEQAYLADAFDPGQTVLHIQHSVVAQIRHVIAVVRRQQMHDHGEVGRAFHRGDTKTPDFFRQTRFGLGDPVLHQLLCLVRIGAELERDGKRHQPVGRRLAAHIEHAFDAVDRFLDRCRDGCRDHLRIGAGILRRDDDRGRYDLGIFRDRQGAQGEKTRDEYQDR